MRKLLFVFLVLLTVNSVFAGPTKFNPEKAQDSEKFAKSILNAKIKKLSKLGIKKLVILECYGEFVTSKEVTNSANSQRSTGWKRTKTSTIEFDKDFYSFTSNRVYEAVKEAFENNGIEIITTEELQKNEVYTNFNLEEEKKGRGVKSGLFKPTEVEKTQKVSATGLGIFPGSPLKMIKLVMNVAEITHSVGADGFLQIKFKVDKGKKAKPIINQFDVLLSADIRSQEVGFKGNKKMRYDLHTQWQPIFTLKNAIITQDDVIEGKKGPLDVKKYDNAMMEILYAITNAIDATLAKAKK